MKTDLSTLCIACLLLAACGDRNAASTHRPATRCDGALLTTHLPQARLEGTQPPVRLPMLTPGYGPRR